MKFSPFRWHLCLVLAPLLTGCTGVEYYGQAIQGHFEVMGKARPIEQILNDPATDPKLRDRLRLVQEIHAFAVKGLHLPDNGSYHSYADLGRDQVSWVVAATPEFSIEPQRWCFPVVGCLNYRGYFIKAAAEAEAAKLRKQGLDVDIAGSTAYSTLGWFDDPLLNTLISGSDARLAEVIFHELAHQRIYFKGDTGFNEAFAVALSRRGVIAWFVQKGDKAAIDAYGRQLRQGEEFHLLLLETREDLRQLYAGKQSPEAMREGKRRIFSGMRLKYAGLKQSWDGYAGYDAWMAQDLNNAHLSLVATYQELVPRFIDLIQKCGSDLPRFYRQVEQWRELDAGQRKERLIRGDCS